MISSIITFLERSNSQTRKMYNFERVTSLVESNGKKLSMGRCIVPFCEHECGGETAMRFLKRKRILKNKRSSTKMYAVAIITAIGSSDGFPDQQATVVTVPELKTVFIYRHESLHCQCINGAYASQIFGFNSDCK